MPAGTKHLLPSRIEGLLATLSTSYAKNKEGLFQQVIVNATCTVDAGSDYDNWDGGQWGHSVRLSIPAELFQEVLGNLEEVKQKIAADLNRIANCAHEYVASVTVEQTADADIKGWREKSGALRPASSRSISEVTRRNIFDTLAVEQIRWAGRLDQDTFLGRIYDLGTLPSKDFRFKTAGQDIHQHTVMNSDWDFGWVFSDDRFDLMTSDDAFLRFLCEMVNPVVRPDEDETRKVVTMLNNHLGKDGWELHEVEYISGKPVFQARRTSTGTAVAKQVKVLAKKVDSEYIARQAARMMESVERDPELAIGTAKELVETVCKTILHERGVESPKDADLPQLNKATFKSLRLVPDEVPEHAKGAETIRRMLSNLASVTQGLAELRGLYGTGHGKHGRSKSIHPRHARLAVGAASTLAAFLYETHLENREAVPE